jgi:hypothetical protein
VKPGVENQPIVTGCLHANLRILRGQSILVQHLPKFIDTSEGVKDFEGVSIEYFAILI